MWVLPRSWKGCGSDSPPPATGDVVVDLLELYPWHQEVRQAQRLRHAHEHPQRGPGSQVAPATGRLLDDAESRLEVDHGHAHSGPPVLLAVDKDVGGAEPVGLVVAGETRSGTAGARTGLCGNYRWKVNDDSFKLVPASQFTTLSNVVTANSNAPAAGSGSARHSFNKRTCFLSEFFYKLRLLISYRIGIWHMSCSIVVHVDIY